MNKLAIALSAAVAVGASFSASAQNGTITINGEVTSTTCDIKWPGTGGSDLMPTVTLPGVPTSTLSVEGATAGKQPIILQVGGPGTSCTSGIAALELNPNRDSDQTEGYLNNKLVGAGDATNVQIALRDADDAPINVSTPWRSKEIDIGASEEIHFAAEYRASGVATPGNVSAEVNYTIDYR